MDFFQKQMKRYIAEKPYHRLNKRKINNALLN